MITAVVTAKISPDMTAERYARHAETIAERFRSIPGLIRKQFLFSADEGLAGGVYLWEDRAAADACYAGVWGDNFRNAFGCEPTIQFFDSPVVVDNERGRGKVAA